MCLYEKRTLTIPSNMAYGTSLLECTLYGTENYAGSRGFGSLIPPNSALVFDVELVELDSNNPRQEL